MQRREGSDMEVLERYGDILPFLEQVVAYADSHREALGFLPKSLFQEFARSGDLYVLSPVDGPEQVCAGYLLFQRRFPRASVLQMFVAPEFRRMGCAKILCDRLISVLTQAGFLSIYARVGEDLSEANQC